MKETGLPAAPPDTQSEAGSGATAKPSGPRQARSTTRRRKPHLPRRIYRRLEKGAAELAKRLSGDTVVAPYIASDRRVFREDLLFAVKRQFPLKSGRPGDPRLDKAYELVRQGRSVTGVLRKQIKNWEQLDPYTRYLVAKGLRQAVRRREKRCKP